mmetsp:Transcript_60275/g.123831  ORF Transcript_60275/g.123831 Transcript_60275/m.123831 type:complete len:274 (+) Transcript_60275:81-902(+)
MSVGQCAFQSGIPCTFTHNGALPRVSAMLPLPNMGAPTKPLTDIFETPFFNGGKSRGFDFTILQKKTCDRTRQRRMGLTAASGMSSLVGKMMTSFVLMALGDILQQSSDLKASGSPTVPNDLGTQDIARTGLDPVMIGAYDLGRTTRLAMFGAMIGAPICHVWFPVLESAVPLRGRGFDLGRSIATRVIVDQVVTSPINAGLFLGWTSYWENMSTQGIGAKLKKSLPVLLPMSALVWMPVNTITFSVIPDQWRVLWIGSVSILWNALLSGSGV